MDALKAEKGKLRRLAMDLLFRHGGLRGSEIGALFGIGYSAISQERKRLWKSEGKDTEFGNLMRRLEEKLSTMKMAV